ncbi:MAG: beta-hydroxyacyl-ACP dehydratase [Planctomycetaceae bacterium]|nr:beta-hydroxyacyl-ACP dehydratase [Planctomycetaceae bacterium]
MIQCSEVFCFQAVASKNFFNSGLDVRWFWVGTGKLAIGLITGGTNSQKQKNRVKYQHVFIFQTRTTFPDMHFSLVDRIVSLEPNKQITVVKSLSLAEEYLQDHFPKFPVMPGVLMLEALTQASAWLIRVSEDFAHSIVVLKEAKNVKYARFVQPGQTLTLTAVITKQEGNLTTLKTEGSVDGQTNLKAQLVLCAYNTADNKPELRSTDEKVIAELRQKFRILYQYQ